MWDYALLDGVLSHLLLPRKTHGWYADDSSSARVFLAVLLFVSGQIGGYLHAWVGTVRWVERVVWWRRRV